ncbi:MAG: YjfI family protein [Gammaproteobacteria bacterium]|nr:YjfI family protein [Gammaproteobacteria bacterium]
MNRKSSAHYQREFRRRMRENGLVKKEVWIRPDNAKLLTTLEKRLREVGARDAIGEFAMRSHTPGWDINVLHEALSKESLIKEGRATSEVIDGVGPSIYLVMREFGDLPLFLTVSGDQIIVESVLWEKADVVDVESFNEAVLRTHKYFPLSTISLDRLEDGKDYYQMFGALSSESGLSEIVLEIETLASNVIQATEAYGEFLKYPMVG